MHSKTTNTSILSLQGRQNIGHCMNKSNKKIISSSDFFHSNKESSLHHVISSSTKCATYDNSFLSTLPSTSKSIRVTKSDDFKMYKNRFLYMIFLIILMVPAIISFILILSPMRTDEFIRRGINTSHGAVTTNKIRSSSAFKSKQNYLQTSNEDREEHKPFRILHIITSLDEYENGERETEKGSNRLINLVIPTLRSTLESFTREENIRNEEKDLFGLDTDNWVIDVYVILGYKCNERCHKLLKDVIVGLPYAVGMEIWDDAIPFNHGFWPEDKDQVLPMPYALARQHRFVVKDKLEYYDFFSSWEDDMKITADHIKTFLKMSNEIERLKKEEKVKIAVSSSSPLPNINSDKNHTAPLRLKQLERMIPGFIRVEVLEDGYMSQEKLDPIPLDDNVTIDPNPCCAWETAVNTRSKNSSITTDRKDSMLQDADIKIPVSNLKPTKKDIVLWETTILGLRVRKMSNSFLNWIGLLPAVSIENDTEGANIQSYWSGTKGYFGNEPEPLVSHPWYMAQQAGWMMTKEQILYADEHNCKKGFLPPFLSDNNDIHNDEEKRRVHTRTIGWEEHGLKAGYHSVEFWSGGYQLFCRECNLQRFISLDPDMFSRQLIFHVSNNKQKQRPRQRFVLADHLLKQLHTIRKDAADYAPSLVSTNAGV